MRRMLRAAVCTVALLVAVTPSLRAQSGLGQVFTAPGTNTFLASVFTGQLSGFSPGAAYTFSLFTYSGSLTGSALFQQAATGPVAQNQTVNIGLMLVPGQTYAFMLQSSTGGTGANGDFHIPDGFLVSCTGTTTCSTPLGPTTDVAGFATNFTAGAVPEPASLTLLGTGLAGLFASRRKRRARVSA